MCKNKMIGKRFSLEGLPEDMIKSIHKRERLENCVLSVLRELENKASVTEIQIALYRKYKIGISNGYMSNVLSKMGKKEMLKKTSQRGVWEIKGESNDERNV